MAARYFKKYSPGTAAILTINGTSLPIRFDTLDHILGWYGTEDENVQNELVRLIKEQRGGISEVSAEEYHENYAQKKIAGETTPISPWREELSRSAGLGLVNREVIAQAGGESLAALAVSGTNDIIKQRSPGRKDEPPTASNLVVADPPPDSPAPSNAARAPEQPQFKPTLGQRKPANVPRTAQNRPPVKN